MKAYTDLEQSKKLAEILSVDSADMFFVYDYLIGDFGGVDFIRPGMLETDDVPCWSLAALLEALPAIDDGNRNPVVCKDIRLNKWHIVYYSTAVEAKIDSGVYDSLVDACVEMIITLKEKDLL